MRRLAIALSASLTLAACASVPSASADPAPTGPPPIWAALGQRVVVDGPQVTPLEVLEDSRCPVLAQCIWAGRVRIRVMVHLGPGDKVHEMTSGEPIQVADGTLELIEVRPDRTSDGTLSPGDYRFGFRFMGGL